MKNIIIFICCSFVLLACSSYAENSTTSANKKPQENIKQVNAKCHVALIDGSEEILLYRIAIEKYRKLADSIVGSKVSTSTSNKKIKVFRAYECVLEDDAFTSRKAQSLDRNTLL